MKYRNRTMRINNILPISKSNGPNTRFVIWVQGCSRKCKNCFNPATHDQDGGCELSVSDIIQQIPMGEVTGITISGGEPFEQAEELALLLEQAGQKGLNRLVYTGFTYEEFFARNDKTIEKCLSLVDILIDGPYMQEIPPVLPWTGSGNQRILQLNHGKIERICKKTDFNDVDDIAGEIIIDQNGNITATGIIDLSTFRL